MHKDALRVLVTDQKLGMHLCMQWVETALKHAQNFMTYTHIRAALLQQMHPSPPSGIAGRPLAPYGEYGSQPPIRPQLNFQRTLDANGNPTVKVGNYTVDREKAEEMRQKANEFMEKVKDAAIAAANWLNKHGYKFRLMMTPPWIYVWMGGIIMFYRLTGVNLLELIGYMLMI